MTKTLARHASLVALLAALATTVAAQPVAPASQAPSNDEWAFTVAPYLVVAGMSGAVGIKDYDGTVDMSASDVLSHLKGGFMGYAGAKKNGWGFGVDAIYAKLGATATKGPVTIDPTMSSGLYTFLASRRIAPVADLVFGARVNTLTTTLAFTAPVQKQLSGSKTWIDPVVGVNIAVPAGERSKVTLLADAGGFGAASTIAADILATVQVRVAAHAWFALGYRYIYTDYNDDSGFLYKVTVQGPVLGFIFPF